MGVSLSRTEWLKRYGCWPTALSGQGDGWGFARLSRKAALARPVTGLLIRLALGSFTLAHSARINREDAMTTTTFILLLNAFAQLLATIAQLLAVLRRRRR
jgi:hypothetical protein